MYNVKYGKKLILFAIFVFIVYKTYHRTYMGIQDISKNIQKNYLLSWTSRDNGSADYLINTPGCFIPNYLKTYQIKEAKPVDVTCGKRAIFIQKINNDVIKFRIEEKVMRYYTKGIKYMCCYMFATASIVSGKEDYTELRYSSCTNFENNTEIALEHEFVVVKCVIKKKKTIIYEDAYVILKKISTKYFDDSKKEHWNVFILGMDTMSRARVHASMPSTTDYLLQSNWLDYKGYQKVGYNTFPNVLALLTGKKVSTVYSACSAGMDSCNDLIIWSAYHEAGYVTATGEEYLRLPDTFAKFGYKTSPTDHYLRPFFLTGERSIGNLVCTKKMPSGMHMLDYASQFVNSYKDRNFFGMFWLNSYSHNLENTPTPIDEYIVHFFKSLNRTGVLDNTFVFFLSDHGIRFGKMRVPYESYYDERLPMFFLWVPYNFRKNYFKQYHSLQVNQNRLVTPYDVHLTLREILSLSTKSNQNMYVEGCPNCVSMFKDIDNKRKCNDVNVDEKWCSCHKMTKVSTTDADVLRSIEITVKYLQEFMKNTPTIACMKCIILELKNILRVHTYRDESTNSTYFIVAFVMTPGDIAFETTTVKRSNEIDIIQPIHSITSYNARGSCVIVPYHRQNCVCAKVSDCKKQKNIN